jgi:hypothetical protein
MILYPELEDGKEWLNRDWIDSVYTKKPAPKSSPSKKRRKPKGEKRWRLKS